MILKSQKFGVALAWLSVVAVAGFVIALTIAG